MTTEQIEARVRATGEILSGTVRQRQGGVPEIHLQDGRHVHRYERADLDWVRALVRADQLEPTDLTDWNGEVVSVFAVAPEEIHAEWRNPLTGAFDGDGGRFWIDVDPGAMTTRYDRDPALVSA